MTEPQSNPPSDSEVVTAEKRRGWNTEDWWSVAVGVAVLLASLASVLANQPADQPARLEAWSAAQTRLDQLGESPVASSAQRKAATAAVKDAKKQVAPNPLSAWLGKMSQWSQDPRTAFQDAKGRSVMAGLAVLFAAMGCLFGLGAWTLGRPVGQFIPGFIGLSLLAVLAQLLADQELIKHYNLEYALWALLVGMIISNTVGTPQLLMSAVADGVLHQDRPGAAGGGSPVSSPVGLGAARRVRFVGRNAHRVDLDVHLRAARVADTVPSLNMVISADMSVCGVSAAIATAAACKAKKEELSLAIGLSLSFTVVMMVVMPAVIRAVGMSSVLGGAWIGGTIDSTGAVAAAGGLLGKTAPGSGRHRQDDPEHSDRRGRLRRGGLLGDLRGTDPDSPRPHVLWKSGVGSRSSSWALSRASLLFSCV